MAGSRGAKLLASKAARKAAERLRKMGIEKTTAAHIAEHFTMIAGKATHTLFKKELRSTAAVQKLITEALKKGRAPVLSVSEGRLSWVIEREMGRAIGEGGETVLRVIVDLKGRLISAFPTAGVIKAATSQGIRVTAAGSAAIVAVTTAYEGEAAAAESARERFEKANEPSWWEYLLPWGPSSTLGFEPNPAMIRRRAAAAIREIETNSGVTLDEEDRADIESDIRSLWYSSG